MTVLAKTDILSLSILERIQLVEDIWDTIAEIPQAIALTDVEKIELDRRLENYHQDPAAGSPWAMVRERITKRV